MPTGNHQEGQKLLSESVIEMRENVPLTLCTFRTYLQNQFYQK